MSGIRVITPEGSCDVPIDVELEGKDAIDAYVAANLTPHEPSAAPPVAPVAPPSPSED